ncbi:MAG: hypothetical protein JRJ87_10720 [Deltaproteobacteria bacterium]|nr:hypothetical protein [Deltaproteobacteria bacterium]
MQIELRVSFETWGGPAPGPVIEMNQANFTDYRLSLGASIGEAGMYFIGCTCDTLEQRVVDYTLEDGDTLSIQICSFCGDICKNSQGIIPRAEMNFSGQNRAVEDPTRAGIVFGQHDWSANVLVYLREPLAGYTGVVIELGIQLQGQTAHLFDQTLQIIETKAINSTEIRQGW